MTVYVTHSLRLGYIIFAYKTVAGVYQQYRSIVNSGYIHGIGINITRILRQPHSRLQVHFVCVNTQVPVA